MRPRDSNLGINADNGPRATPRYPRARRAFMNWLKRGLTEEVFDNTYNPETSARVPRDWHWHARRNGWAVRVGSASRKTCRYEVTRLVILLTLTARGRAALSDEGFC